MIKAIIIDLFVVAIALGMGVILFTMILNMITSFKSSSWFLQKM